jgi:hypothetical protein
MDGRVRRSCGSEDVQVAQVQPIIGTPCDVPVPRKVIFNADCGLLSAECISFHNQHSAMSIERVKVR